MASTFTLKRKTYTAWDYKNDVAYDGFNAGYAYAIQKMYGNPAFGKIADQLRGKFGNVDEYMVKAGLRNKSEVCGQALPQGFAEAARNAFGDLGKDPKWREHHARASKMLGFGKSAPMGPVGANKANVA